MIRVLLVSGHPALRAGLAHVIDREPGLGVEVVDSSSAAVASLARLRPDVVLLDVPLPGEDAFAGCHALTQLATRRRVALYADCARADLRLAAWMAGADALMDKTAPVPTLFDQLRMVAAGRRVLPRPSPAALGAVLGVTDAHERAVLGMCMHGVELSEISRALRRDPLEVERTVRRLLGRVTAGSAA